MKKAFIFLLGFTVIFSFNRLYAQNTNPMPPCSCITSDGKKYQIYCQEATDSTCYHDCDCTAGRRCSGREGNQGYCRGYAWDLPDCEIGSYFCVDSGAGYNSLSACKEQGKCDFDSSEANCDCSWGRGCEGNGVCNNMPTLLHKDSTKKPVK